MHSCSNNIYNVNIIDYSTKYIADSFIFYS